MCQQEAESGWQARVFFLFCLRALCIWAVCQMVPSTLRERLLSVGPFRKCPHRLTSLASPSWSQVPSSAGNDMNSNVGVGWRSCLSIVEGYLPCDGAPYRKKHSDFGSVQIGWGIPAEGLLVSADTGRTVFSRLSLFTFLHFTLHGNH